MFYSFIGCLFANLSLAAPLKRGTPLIVRLTTSANSNRNTPILAEVVSDAIIAGETVIIQGTYLSHNNKRCFAKLKSLEGFNFKHIAGDVTINNLSKLSDLGVFMGLESGQNITIENCPELYDFTPLQNVLTDYNYIFYTNGNGYNPTRYQIFNGNGKP